MAKTLVNFLVEPELLNRFDAVADILGRTRTSILVEFIQNFCLDQVVEIEKRNKRLDELSAALERQRILLEHRATFFDLNQVDDKSSCDLPEIMFQDDHWETF